MIRKKICLLGSFAVGKTSLAARFVDRPFTGRYLTTIGVRIDRKLLAVGGREVTLLIWDMAGEDRFQQVEASYLRGSSGYLLVVDGTRRSTLDQALALHERARGVVGDVPFEMLLNKADLADSWAIGERDLSPWVARGMSVLRTSAKSGEGVESALCSLAGRMLAV
ncbi:MAG: GTP-binding protein [Verrucomicrobiales bacterium]|nr:GTP-binding protein [Verrucomicrobiales bacterium]